MRMTTRFTKRARAGSIVLSAALAGLGTVTGAAAGKTVFFPSQESDFSKAIQAAGMNGTIVVEAGAHDLAPGPDSYMAYKLLEGQTLTGQGLAANGKPVSTLRFVGNYATNTRPYSIGLWVGKDVTVTGLAFEAGTIPTIPGKPFVAPIVAFGDRDEPAITNARIVGNRIEGFPRYGIYLTNCNNASVLNNVIVPTTNQGIGIALSSFPIGADANANTISGNKIDGGSVVFQDGIHLFQFTQTGTAGSSHNTIEGNEIVGKVSRIGIALDQSSHQNSVLNNDLSKLTAGCAQMRLRLGSDDNFVANNELGAVDWDSDPATVQAGLWIQTVGNTIVDTGCKGNYPGWHVDRGCVFLDHVASDPKSQSAGNTIVSSLPAPQLCQQMLDIGTDNKIPGFQGCPKTPQERIDQLRNRPAGGC